jgi:hypothetical protein
MTARYEDIPEMYAAAVRLADSILNATPEAVERHEPADVLQISVAALPHPDESTSWNELLDFKSDPDVQYQLNLFRRWIRKCSSTPGTAIEIREELEDMIADYSAAVRRHRLKLRPGVIEAALCVSGELVENLVKLQWGKAAQALFKVRHNKIALLEAEMSSPGREVAYVFRARERFGDT